jgi:hypothetical protein
LRISYAGHKIYKEKRGGVYLHEGKPMLSIEVGLFMRLLMRPILNMSMGEHLTHIRISNISTPLTYFPTSSECHNIGPLIYSTHLTI